MELYLVKNQSKIGEYNPIPVDVTRKTRRFLRVSDRCSFSGSLFYANFPKLKLRKNTSALGIMEEQVSAPLKPLNMIVL